MSRNGAPKWPTFVSLFSGCGGFDAGFVEEGFRCLGAFDIDSTALDVHFSNLGAPVYQRDLSQGLPDEFRASNPDVVIAGSPCQGFSTIGQRRLHDPRNRLLLEAGRIAVSLSPRVFVVENVIGVTAGSHAKYWRELERLLRESNYSTLQVKLNANELGLPQRRRRMLLIAWRGGERRDFLPKPRASITLRSALAGLCGLPDHDVRPLSPTSLGGRIARSIGPGQKLSDVRASHRAVHTWDLPHIFGSTTRDERAFLLAFMKLRRTNRVRTSGDSDPQPLRAIRRAIGENAIATADGLVRKGYLIRSHGLYDLAHRFNGAYRRLHWEEPSPTVDTRFGDPRLFLHPEEHRGLTVREAARIQGFDDTFCFAGSRRDRYTMIGNAVPPTIAASIAELIRDAFFSA